MRYLYIKHWRDFQIISPGRTPVWIKLYTRLLDDADFLTLDPQDRLALMMLWLLAARLRSTDGGIPADEKYLRNRIGCTVRLEKLTTAPHARTRPWLLEKPDRTSDPSKNDDPGYVVGTDDVREVFDHWSLVMGRTRAVLDPKRAHLIRERLHGFSVAELKMAIDGCKASAWHQGENDRGRPYDDISLICRDAQHVEEFMAKAPVGKTTINRPKAIKE